MSEHVGTRVCMPMPKAQKVVLDARWPMMEILVIPNHDTYIAAMLKVQTNYARHHGIPFWEVGVRTDMDIEHNIMTFTAYHKIPQPRGDNS
jgi:hypothetical protein